MIRYRTWTSRSRVDPCCCPLIMINEKYSAIWSYLHTPSGWHSSVVWRGKRGFRTFILRTKTITELKVLEQTHKQHIFDPLLKTVLTCSDERLDSAGLSTLSSLCKFNINIFSHQGMIPIKLNENLRYKYTYAVLSQAIVQ